MVLTPAPHRHELDNTIHATLLYTTARLHPISMQLPAVQEGQSMPEAVLLRQQHGSWERTRRAPRPQPDGGDAHRAMLPDHARYPPQGRAARVRWPCRQRRSGHHHLRRYPPQACRRCANHNSTERGAGTRPAQGPTRAEGSRATGIDMACLLYTSPSPRDKRQSRMPSSA